MSLRGVWKNTNEVSGHSYNCGYCGTFSSPSRYYYCDDSRGLTTGVIFICSKCNQPTFIDDFTSTQTPGPIIGREINHLPEPIRSMYDEARRCVTVGANTSAVLACRKILMNVAVQEGAEVDKNFHYYVNFLETNNFLPPKGRQWVDQIRIKGNEATHEITSMTLQDATELINFIEMLLRFVYEFPAMVTPRE